MAEELEIKLSLSAGNQERALKWLLAQSGTSEGQRKKLVNRYFDTPEADLNRQRIALRVRQAGDQFIQTLKTQGEFVDGAHRRQEWEWPLTRAELDTGLLADTPVGQNINLAELKPVFETNFDRQIVMFEFSDAVIEVAVDLGLILAGENRRELCEIEFELKSGNPAHLLSGARALASRVPVFLNVLSKAEQGYYLAGLHDLPSVGDAKDTASWSVEVFFRRLSVCWLRGEAMGVCAENLSSIQERAVRNGAESCFQAVWGGLTNGQPVSRLALEPNLGQLQLAIAAG